jgi:glycosyltransferase involved in cell wall biosynthesis
MLVSVIIPAYNAAEYLREAIESVLAQTYQSFEIIVVDDGSTDHTRDVCASFGSKLRYIYQENDGTGGGGAQTHGIRESSGELIAFLDQDDRWRPDKLKKQIRALETHPKARLVLSPSMVINSGGQELHSRDLYVGKELTGEVVFLSAADAFHLQLKARVYCPSSAMIYRSFFDEYGFIDQNNVGVGDWELWLKVARRYPIVVVNETLADYRVSAGQFVNNQLRLAMAMRRTLVKQRPHFHPNCAECRQSFAAGKELVDNIFHCAARGFLDQYHAAALGGEPRSAIPFFWQALRASPREVLGPRRLMAISKNFLLGKVKKATSRGSGAADVIR